MAARQSMHHRALVQRSTSAGTDDSGNPLPASWATHIAAMPCKLYSSSGREAVDPERTIAVVDLKLLAPRDAAVTTDDRINGVVDRRGTSILPGVARIEAVMHKETHQEISLTQVAS